MLLTLLLAQAALAHPNEADFHSMRADIRVGAELQVAVALEIPTMKVLRDFVRIYGDQEGLGQEQDREYLLLQCKQLGDGLTLSINGSPAAGSWEPLDHPGNGRTGEGFFTYMVGFVPTEPLGDSEYVEVKLVNRAKPKAKMYLSAYVSATEPYKIVSSSAEDILGDAVSVVDANDDPEAWSVDPQLRTLEVTAKHLDPPTEKKAEPVTIGPRGCK